MPLAGDFCFFQSLGSPENLKLGLNSKCLLASGLNLGQREQKDSYAILSTLVGQSPQALVL